MMPSAPASAPSAPAQNPDTGAAELMSPGSIALPNTPAPAGTLSAGAPAGTPPAPAVTVDATTWMTMVRNAIANANRKALGPQIHSYVAPPPILVAVPNSTWGATGTSYYQSAESAVQQIVASISGAIASEDMTDAQVSVLLDAVAKGQAAYSNVGGADPSANNIDALVAKYTAIYRQAVTPV